MPLVTRQSLPRSGRHIVGRVGTGRPDSDTTSAGEESGCGDWYRYPSVRGSRVAWTDTKSRRSRHLHRRRRWSAVPGGRSKRSINEPVDAACSDFNCAGFESMFALRPAPPDSSCRCSSRSNRHCRAKHWERQSPVRTLGPQRLANLRRT